MQQRQIETALASHFELLPANVRAEYPEGGGNHILHLQVTEEGEPADGQLARKLGGMSYYVTKLDDGWTAQRVTLDNPHVGIVDCWYAATKYRTRRALLAYLARR